MGKDSVHYDPKLFRGSRDPVPPTLVERFRLRLFGTGYLQVIFVAMNTVFISHYELIANTVTALAISYIWTHNVKKLAFGDERDRWAYALGAAFGSVSGTVLAGIFV